MATAPRTGRVLLAWAVLLLVLCLMAQPSWQFKHLKHKKFIKALLAGAFLRKRVIPIPIPFHQENHHPQYVPVPQPIPYKVPVHTIHKHHHHTKHVHHYKHTRGRNTLVILDKQHQRKHGGW
ncbi:hypothetical protein HPB47_023774 [Ixodes persulcatus]|uniref:Uncharacterized protein n=1 Tax=Ixodes persulcatus TaxID=34615 RepID=A0AC60Q812_IXOPE|nr:hypothetical protein HPB47_023774 [Ixodes persulcatus]